MFADDVPSNWSVLNSFLLPFTIAWTLFCFFMAKHYAAAKVREIRVEMTKANLSNPRKCHNCYTPWSKCVMGTCNGCWDKSTQEVEQLRSMVKDHATTFTEARMTLDSMAELMVRMEANATGNLERLAKETVHVDPPAKPNKPKCACRGSEGVRDPYQC